MKLASVSGTTLTFSAKPSAANIAAAVGTAAGNAGRGAFGTDDYQHAAVGTFEVYRFLGSSGSTCTTTQGTYGTQPGCGAITVYDPRVTIRQISSMSASSGSPRM